MGVGSNGQNGHIQPRENGGRGNCSLADLIPDDPHRQRGAAEMIATAIRNGYLDAFCVDYRKVKKWAEELAQSDEPRAKAAGVKVLTTMAQHDLKLWELLGAKEAASVVVNVENTVYTATFK